MAPASRSPSAPSDSHASGDGRPRREVPLQVVRVRLDRGEPGPHNFHRGGPLAFYEGETRDAIAALKGEIDTPGVLSVWEAALNAPEHDGPRWLHGDLTASNLLVRGGRLKAVIDFGICGVGDPSCDLKMARTFFEGSSRQAFRDRLGLDAATWARCRGWALWKCLKTLAEKIE
jgi:aminoglycoside phosphotransferase (APT) family kinase protein